MLYIFELPTSILIPRKTKDDKKIMLNMNVYRNLHHSVSNQVKQSFKPDKIPEKFFSEKIRISYLVFKKSKRKYDTMNVVSIVDKCFLDWLVLENYIPDDTCKNVEYGSIKGWNENDREFVRAVIEVIL